MRGSCSYTSKLGIPLATYSALRPLSLTATDPRVTLLTRSRVEGRKWKLKAKLEISTGAGAKANTSVSLARIWIFLIQQRVVGFRCPDETDGALAPRTTRRAGGDGTTSVRRAPTCWSPTLGLRVAQTAVAAVALKPAS